MIRRRGNRPRLGWLALLATAAVLMCAVSQPTMAAITDNGASTSKATVGTAPNLSWSHEVFAGDDRVLIVGLSLELGQSTAVTYDGLPLTLAGRYTGTSSHTIEMWYRVAPPVGNATILATFDASREVIGGATAFNGVDPVTPTSGLTGASTDSDSPSVTISSAVGELVIDTLFVDIDSLTATPEASQSERWNLTNGRLGAGSTEPGAVSVVMDWSLSGPEEWTLAGASIKPAVGSTISGRVFEDADFAGTASAYNAAADKTLQGVDVELYNGATDAYITSTVSAADGSYSFSSLADGSYKVRVRSATIGSGTATPKGGLNASVPATWPNPLAEMTWANGATAYGGQAPTVDDTATGDNAGPGDNWVAVSVSGANVGGVDFGFAYNLIVNTTDDANAGNIRSAQGSLRQFLKNANAIGSAGGTTANASEFRMQVPANQVSGADTWWRWVPVAALPSLADGATVLDGTSQTANGGNSNALGPEIEIFGNGIAADGLDLASAGNVVRGLILNGFSTNFNAAVRMVAASSTGNTVAGNYIGTDHAAQAAVPNYFGLRIVSGPSSNTIGGSVAADRNVISGNSEAGIFVTGGTTTGNVIKGNFIGTDRNGTGEVPNANGIDIFSNASGTVVGGSAPNDTNVISGNDGEGIYLSGGDTSTIQGNIIGADVTGSFALPNRRGVWIASDAVGNLVGGTTSDLRNLISGNGFNGIVLSQAATQSNTIVGNYIGTDSSGVAALPNFGHGVQIQFDPSNNTIGGTASGEANVIAFNTEDGVFVDGSGSDTNRISGNAIFSNGGLGIDLAPDGIGTGSGANNDKAAPVIASLTSTGSGFTAVVATTAGDTVELYRVNNAAAPAVAPDTTGSGEGYLFLGSCVDNGACSGPHLAALPDANPAAGTVEATLQPSGTAGGDRVSATATDASGNTSEFASNVLAELLADLSLTKTDSPDPAPLDGPLVYTLVITNNGPDTATGVSVTDVLPASATLVTATPSQGSCSGTTTVTCSLGGIANTGTASVEILVTTNATGMITNNASVTADQTDPVAGNNAASEDTDVVADSAILDLPLTQYRRIHGFVDYTVTGGSLRTMPNGSGGAACAVGASSSASISGIPGTATVSAAYLYWGGSGATVDANVTFDGGGVTADRTFQGRFSLGANDYEFFGGFEDVTAQVIAKRNGSYSFQDLTVDTADPYCKARAVMAGWALLVIYDDNALSGKTLVLYDGFDIERNGSTSYLLTGIYSADPPEAKTTFLVWEGDPDLAGASESLAFNGTSQSDGLNPVDNVYNSTINSLGSTTSYGLDLDTFDVSSEVAPADTLATVQVSVNSDLVILNAVVLQVKSNLIAGYVFEDVNYGGGAGRNRATATAAAPTFTVDRPGATIELYDAAGNFLRTTTTSASGEYGFTGLVDGTYQVRVVNDTVSSSRPGSTGAELAVQTYRTNASSGTAVAVPGEVGGAAPSAQDSPANAGMVNLSSITAQSVTPALITTGIAVPDVDFGYNFDTIVNTNDAGQGSLRQFILNSNLLTNANLAQDGLTAGTEHSLFMIPSATDPLGRAKAPGFDAARGVAVITPDTLMDAITEADTALDGTTQTASVGNSNATTLGTGGSVGVSGLGLPMLAGPEIEIIDDMGLTVGIDVQANDTTIRGLAIYGFGTGLADGNLRVGLSSATNFTGVTVEDNVLGGFADSFTDPDLAVADSGTVGACFTAQGADFGTLQRNLIGFSGRTAAVVSQAANDWTIQQNEFRGGGLDDARSDGLGLTDNVERTSVTGNLFAANQGAGVDFFSSVGTHTLLNNTFDGNGQGGVETAGVRMFGSGGTIDRNVFTGQTGSGVLAVVSDPAFPTANTPATQQRITQNHFGGNGANAIDLQTTLDIVAPGDGITPNDGTLLGDSSVANACGTVATHGNEGLDTPIVDLVLMGGGGATVRGRACPGAEVEIYRAVADGDSSDTLSGTDYGEGVAYLATVTAAAGTGLFEATGVAGLSAGDRVSAIAIDANDNTSEFSNNLLYQSLSIVKRAFQLDGTPIASGSTLPAGMPVKFMLYIDNAGNPVADVSLQDVLDPLFVYQSSSIKVDDSLDSATTCPGGTCSDATIFAKVDGTPSVCGMSGSECTDAQDADPVSVSGVTIHAGDGVQTGNAQLDLPAGKVLAISFTIIMQ